MCWGVRTIELCMNCRAILPVDGTNWLGCPFDRELGDCMEPFVSREWRTILCDDCRTRGLIDPRLRQHFIPTMPDSNSATPSANLLPSTWQVEQRSSSTASQLVEVYRSDMIPLFAAFQNDALIPLRNSTDVRMRIIVEWLADYMTSIIDHVEVMGEHVRSLEDRVTANPNDTDAIDMINTFILNILSLGNTPLDFTPLQSWTVRFAELFHHLGALTRDQADAYIEIAPSHDDFCGIRLLPIEQRRWDVPQLHLDTDIADSADDTPSAPITSGRRNAIAQGDGTDDTDQLLTLAAEATDGTASSSADDNLVRLTSELTIADSDSDDEMADADADADDDDQTS